MMLDFWKFRFEGWSEDGEVCLRTVLSPASLSDEPMKTTRAKRNNLGTGPDSVGQSPFRGLAVAKKKQSIGLAFVTFQSLGPVRKYVRRSHVEKCFGNFEMLIDYG